jgi:hypothetical protein
MPDDLNAASFMTHLHTPFRILQSSIPVVNVKLVEVAERSAANGGHPGPTTRQERFSIVFHGPRERLLQQGLYQVQHDQLGDLELFLVPVGQDQTSIYYEAVFNRLRQANA